MPVFARFRAIDDQQKSLVVRKLMEYSTPDFDYFYLVALSVLMATFGLMLDSGAIVIGSMLIAPLMYPLLAVSLGLVMSNYSVLGRSVSTLIRSLGGALILSTAGAFFFGSPEMYQTTEVMIRSEAHVLHFIVAVVAGLAVAYVLSRPEWSDTLPGVAISVALIPPLAAIGIGLASLNPVVIKGATLILALNLVGIIGSAMVIFLLMNLSESNKQKIAESTIKKEDAKQEVEQQAIAEMEKNLKDEHDEKFNKDTTV